MPTVWKFLIDNIPFLTFLVPLAGIVLLAALGLVRGDTVVARRIALGSALVTTLLAGLMVIVYAPNRHGASGDLERVQMTTALPWPGANFESTPPFDESHNHEENSAAVGDHVASSVPGLYFTWGVDGVSLWLLALTAVLAVPAVWADPGARPPAGAGYYALVLTLESSLIGLFAAQDVILFAACLGLCLVPSFFLIGRWGGIERRDVLPRLVATGALGLLLVTVALVGLVTAHARMRSDNGISVPAPTFSVEQLIDGGQSPHDLVQIEGLRQLSSRSVTARTYWNGISPWIFLCFFAGFWIIAALIPLHTWLPAITAQSPASAAILLSGLLPVCGCYGMFRFIVPLFSPEYLRFVEMIPILATTGGVIAALLSLAQTQAKAVIVYVSISHACLAAAGLFSHNVTGVCGALLLVSTTGLCAGVFMYVLSGCATGVPGEANRPSTAGTKSLAGRRAVFLCALLVLIGVPGASGFVGLMLTLVGIFQGTGELEANPLPALLALPALLLGNWALLTLWQRWRSNAGNGRDVVGRAGDGIIPVGDFGRADVVLLSACLAVAAGVGLAPRYCLDRLQPTVSWAVYGEAARGLAPKTDRTGLNEKRTDDSQIADVQTTKTRAHFHTRGAD